MFKHILLPTDGSELSTAAISHGVRLAKSLGAKVTGLYVIPMHVRALGATQVPTEISEQTTTQAKAVAEAYMAAIERAKEVAVTCLSALETEAKAAGIECEVRYERSDYPFEIIIRVAKQMECDLIMMASHGRRGVRALLLGSETLKVLTHSKIPVLVYR